MNWIKNALVVIFSLSVSLVFLEGSLRLLYPEKSAVSNIRDHTDPLMPKHKSGIYNFSQRNTVATFDTSGMRVNPNKCGQKETINALLVGDSNIAGFFLDDSETLGAKITEYSLESDACVVVDTFGVSGFGPDQTLFAIESLTNAHPYDYVIFHIFADNDLGDLIRNNNFRNNQLSNNGYCYIIKPLLEDFIIYKALRKVAVSVGFSSSLFGSPVASNGSSENCLIVTQPNHKSFALAIHERAKLDWNINRNNQRQIYMGDRYDIEFACGAKPEVEKYMQQYLTHIFQSAKRLSHERKFELIYLILPSEFDVTDNHMERLNKGCEKYNPKNLTQFFMTSLKDENVISLYDKFLNCNKCYFSELELSGDNHWSPTGVELAANEIMRFITNRQWN